MNEQIKAGADIHAGDGGYSIGTQERYEEFAKERNRVVNERIRKLAISKGIYDSLCDPYDSHKNGDYHSSVMDDLERFAQLIVDECCSKLLQMDEQARGSHNYYKCAAVQLKEHFKDN